MKIYLYFLTTVLAIILAGCSTTNLPSQESVKEIIKEDASTKALSGAIAKLNEQVAKLGKVTFADDYAAFEKVWGNLQGVYDNLKTQASLPPFDESQIASIKSALDTVKSELQGLDKVNAQVRSKIAATKEALDGVNKSLAEVEKAWAEYNKASHTIKKYTEVYISGVLTYAKAQITAAEAKIKAMEMNARMQNGRAKGLYNSVEAYVKTLKLTQ